MREFLLHLQARFNIVYLGYIIYDNILTIVNLNQSQQ